MLYSSDSDKLSKSSLSAGRGTKLKPTDGNDDIWGQSKRYILYRSKEFEKACISRIKGQSLLSNGNRDSLFYSLRQHSRSNELLKTYRVSCLPEK